MAVTSNRLSIAKQLLDNNLITNNNFDEVSREDDTKSGIERGTELMKALKATINQWPGLMTSLIEVLGKNEAFKSIAMKMGQGCNNEVTDESTIPPSLWSVIKKKLKRNTRSSSTSIHPPISQLSLSPSIEAIHSPTDQLPSKCYFGQVMYEIIRPGREWLVTFLLCKDYDALSQVYACMHALSL